MCDTQTTQRSIVKRLIRSPPRADLKNCNSRSPIEHGNFVSCRSVADASCFDRLRRSYPFESSPIVKP
jgi:hypothetical protein